MLGMTLSIHTDGYRIARTGLLALGLLTLATGTPAGAFDEPRDFWGVAWGASPQELKVVMADQGSVECTRTGRHCFRQARIGAAGVTFGYEFAADKLTAGTIAFASRDYAAVRATFVERFGPPTHADERPETTRGGATFTIGTVRWDGPAAVIVLTNFGSPIDRGLATMMTREEYQRRR